MSLHDRLQTAADDTQNRMNALSPPPLRPQRPWLRVAVAFAALVVVVVGMGALLPDRPGPSQTIPPVAPPPSLVDVELQVSVFPVASFVPEGLELLLSGADVLGPDGFMYYAPPGIDVEIEQHPYLSAQTFSTRSSDGFTYEGVLAAFDAAGIDSVAETTIRGRPAAMATDQSGVVFLVVLEDGSTFTEVNARDVDIDDVTTFAEGLSFVSREDFDAIRLDQIGWDLKANGSETTGPESIRETLEAIPGIADVRFVYFSSSFTPLFRFLLNADQTPMSTTTVGSQVDSPAQQPVAAVPFQAFVKLESDAIPEEAAALLVATEPVHGVEFSPTVAMERRNRFEEMIAGGVILQTEPLVIQAPPSPEPDFDTSTLGIEVPLSPAEPGDELLTPDTPWRARSEVSPPPDQTVVHLGVLEDGGRLYLQLYESEFFYISHLQAGGSSSAGGEGFSYYGYGIAGASSGSDGSFIDVKVPIDTAVVVLHHGDETLWQRPVLGYGLFPVSYALGLVEIIALDADGEELGRWQEDIQ